jgi:putative endonuclease
VAEFLAREGLELLGRNVRVGRWEIDILARDGAVIAVVEVRTRGLGAWQRAFDTVDQGKRQRLRKAAAVLWSRRFARRSDIERMRFDVASVDLESGPEPAVEYVRAAF